MFALANNTGELAIRGKLTAFLNNATALLGLLVFDHPVSLATIWATLIGLVLMVITVTRFVAKYLGPKMRHVALTTLRVQVKALSLEHRLSQPQHF